MMSSKIDIWSANYMSITLPSQDVINGHKLTRGNIWYKFQLHTMSETWDTRGVYTSSILKLTILWKHYTLKGHGLGFFYTIHISSHARRLGPLIRASCFSFESAHNYFKELARKQNFKNLPVSLAKRHNKLECCNFINNHIAPNSRPLHSTKRKTGFVK